MRTSTRNTSPNRIDSGRSTLQKFYGIAEELPTHYDLVINTDALTPELAEATVLAVVGDAA